MKPILIVSPTLAMLLSTFVSVKAITLWPFIISRKPLSEGDLAHEKIHFQQQMELLLIGFYVVYAAEYLYFRLRGYSNIDAYYAIQFEKEAYASADIPGYLSVREMYAWMKY